MLLQWRSLVAKRHWRLEATGVGSPSEPSDIRGSSVDSGLRPLSRHFFGFRRNRTAP